MTVMVARERLEDLSTWMHDEAVEWRVSERVAWAFAIVPIVAAMSVAVSALYRPLYGVFVNEDGLGEWATFAAVLGLVPMGLLIARRLWRLHERSWALLFVVAAAGAFFIAGEEISWGQRVFGFVTPETLAEVNRQGETTIHNIGSVLSFLNLAMFIVAVVAGVMPFIWRWGSRGRPRDVSTMIIVPPLFLATSFLIAAAYRLVRYALLPDAHYVISRYAEFIELLMFGALLSFAILIYRRLPATPQP
jgi:hypothetical protein